MHQLKKYSNGRLYDINHKTYINTKDVANWVKQKEKITIIDSKTGEDITQKSIEKLTGHAKKEKNNENSSSILLQIFQKGSGTLIDFARRYSSLWQKMIFMAEDEVDKVVAVLIKNEEISKNEAPQFKLDIINHSGKLRGWIGDEIDKRINKVLMVMNVATKSQLNELTDKIERLTNEIKKLEDTYNEE